MIQKVRRVSAVALIAILAPTLASASPIVIYDNTGSGFTGVIAGTQQQIGDEVQAAGTARDVTLLEIGVDSQGSAFTADLQARLYANDGVGGQPDTLLWQGNVRSVPLNGGIDVVPFVVPDVLVPDTFTWTLQYGNLPLTLPLFGPASIGSSPDFFWFGGPGSWTIFPHGGDLEARITAEQVPEPSAISSLTLGLACSIGLLSRQRRSLQR